MNVSISNRVAWLSLGTLSLLNLLNYVDRYIVSSLVETLKKSEMHLSDAQAGLLMTAFISVYTLVFPVFGYLGDRVSRPKLLTFAVIIWSLATMASGLAPNFYALLVCRAVVGIGEAAYVTVAPTLIADYFPAEKSGKAYATFFAAIPIGSAIGYVLGGVLDTHFGWRSAFLFTGVPGILLSFMALRLVDPPRVLAAGDAAEKTGGSDAWKVLLLSKSTYLLASVGYAAYAFGLGGLAFWMPAYMERIRGMSHEDAAVITGGLIVVTGCIGTFLGGFCADGLRKRFGNADLVVSWISVLICVPLLVVAFTTSSMPLFWVSLAGAELAIFMCSGPINGAIIASLPLPMRAMGLAICNVITHILGDVPSPSFIGWMSDRSSLVSALMIVPVAFVVCAALWLLAAAQARAELKPHEKAVVN
jgi:MFS family permease